MELFIFISIWVIIFLYPLRRLFKLYRFIIGGRWILYLDRLGYGGWELDVDDEYKFLRQPKHNIRKVENYKDRPWTKRLRHPSNIRL